MQKSKNGTELSLLPCFSVHHFKPEGERSLMTNFGAKVLLCKMLMFCYCWLLIRCAPVFLCLVGGELFRLSWVEKSAK